MDRYEEEDTCVSYEEAIISTPRLRKGHGQAPILSFSQTNPSFFQK
jgi:hypothetical protein